MAASSKTMSSSSLLFTTLEWKPDVKASLLWETSALPTATPTANLIWQSLPSPGCEGQTSSPALHEDFLQQLYRCDLVNSEVSSPAEICPRTLAVLFTALSGLGALHCPDIATVGLCVAVGLA